MSQSAEEVRFVNRRFGELTLSEEQVITFHGGLPGFERFKRFALLEPEDIQPFCWLLSVEDPDLGFVIINPLVFFPEYDPPIAERELVELGVRDPQEVKVYVVVTLASNPRDVTANLCGPVIINTFNRRAKQLALVCQTYSTKHRILASLESH